MTGIIKSGIFVGGVEVTSEHIGRKLVVVESTTTHLTEGCSYCIMDVRVDGIYLLDNDEDEDDLYRVIENEVKREFLTFKWKEVVQLPPKLKSTPTSRKKIAKEIKEIHESLQFAIANAEEHGMIVKLEDNDIKISYQPPMEEY